MLHTFMYSMPQWLIVWTFFYLVSCTDSDNISGEEKFDFLGSRGVQHEFKYEVGPGRMDCFHQRVNEFANLHVSFEVS